MKVAFCCSEVVPFVKTGGLADVCGTLPVALAGLGIEVVLFLPAYQGIDYEKCAVKRLNEHVSQAFLAPGIPVYLIEHPGFFHRGGLYGEGAEDYPDNLERFHYFCREVFRLLKELNIRVDIVHCHDWQTALIPVLLREIYRKDDFFAKVKSVLTIHNLAYQGLFLKEQYPQLGLRKELFDHNGFEFYDKGNLLKAGIVFSDRVSTVSKQYAKEILTEEEGCGLEGVLKSRQEGIVGIVNGIDYLVWSPKTDPLMGDAFVSVEFHDGKIKNKLKLQERLHLSQRQNVPVLGFVGRLSHQKGLDLIVEVMDKIISMDVQMVFLGEGEAKYYQLLNDMVEHFPSKVAFEINFDEQLAHQIYAGSDFFLMPSRYEPCGLSQMIALAYGTIPIVHYTGGLVDTIIPHDAANQMGNGFVFRNYDPRDFLEAVKTALETYRNEKKFSSMIRNALLANFSWEKSAKEYQEMYECLLSA